MESAVSNGDQPDDLDRRRRDLERALASRRAAKTDSGESAKTSGLGAFSKALKVSSEFIAGIFVGAVLGWFIDKMAGTSPWGLIIFLLLGFGAGVLNVLRSAGLVQQFEARSKDQDKDGN
jgi:ATP synthase protein I